MLFFKKTSGFGHIKQVSLLTVGLMTLLQVPVQTALAVSQADRNAIYKNTVWFDNSPRDNSSCGSGPGSPGIPPNQSPTDSVRAFVDAYGQMAYNDAIATGVPWEVTLAQAIIESGYGRSELSARYNNFFGIKAGSDWTGATVEMATTECNANGCYATTATFRAYNSPQESFNDHSDFLRTNSRYANAFNFSNDPFRFLREVADAGYATAPDYYSVVGGIMQQIIEYNNQANLFPPSSEINFNVPPPGSPVSPGPGPGICGGDVAGGNIDVNSLGLNSDNIACAPGTREVGNVTTRYTGAYKQEPGPLIIKLCQVPDVPGYGNDTSGNQISGGVVVNSRVSGAWQALGQAAKAAGVDLFGTSSFRLADSCGGDGDGGACATPGGSPHQMGVAIDFYNQMYAIDTSRQSCDVRVTRQDSPQWRWMYLNADRFGFEQYSAEAWHWDPLPSSNRCNSEEPPGLVPQNVQ